MGEKYNWDCYIKVNTPICEKAFKHINEQEIEVGDIVRVVRLDYNAYPQVLRSMVFLFGECAEVIRICRRDPYGNMIYMLKWIDDDGETQSCWFRADWVELVKKVEKSFSGHVVCVEYTGTTNAFTVGKAYKITNGKLIDNNGDPYSAMPIKSIEDLNARWCKVQFIEYKGGAEE